MHEFGINRKLVNLSIGTYNFPSKDGGGGSLTFNYDPLEYGLASQRYYGLKDISPSPTMIFQEALSPT